MDADRSMRKEMPPGAVEIGMIEAIASWCACVNGRNPIEDGLAVIARSLGAEAAALTRASRGPTEMSRSVFYDARNQRSAKFPLQRSFARALLGKYFDQSTVGAIWFKSLLDGDNDPGLARFHSQRLFSELAVLPLAISDKSIDLLEFHFAERLHATRHATLNVIVATLAKTWTARVPGLGTSQLMGRRNAAVQARLAEPLLTHDNPAKLSRAEYRVCLMLSRGLSNDEIMSELEISKSTLRTHLRHIYEKANVTNQAELTHHLLTLRPTVTSQVGSHVA